jgi:hypothetical protein
MMRHLGEFALPDESALMAGNGLALGLGRQRLVIFPDPEFVLAVTACNDNTLDQWRLPWPWPDGLPARGRRDAAKSR